MYKLKIYTLAIILFSLYNCKGNEHGSAQLFDNLSKLEGRWTFVSDLDTGIEQWKLIGDSALSCYSYIYNGKDTIQEERISVFKKGNDWFYCPLLDDENNKFRVTCFRMISNSEEKLSFENKEHDFPQIISYTFSGSNSMQAEIKGDIDGTERAYRFNMKRMKH